ncbi:hypothetical protein BASA61_005145 [Batrachochytrium salamandrivorans]|nr:hypothetical protein BASA62_000569 [Batrachochytrium salamandrivorans]KAH6590808.1 hypothetical protein BASA61_005145 [Batrachochytrium salamandrivorans]KAH9266125.1 hypothetical protein BASA83_010769 [Batrachochytrium salamandrivorans]
MGAYNIHVYQGNTLGTPEQPITRLSDILIFWLNSSATPSNLFQSDITRLLESSTSNLWGVGSVYRATQHSTVLQGMVHL